MGASHPNVLYLYKDFDAKWRPTLDEIRDIERSYNLPSLADHVYPEYQYWRVAVEKLQARAVFVFRFLEQLLREHTASAFLNNIGGEIIRRCMSRIAETGGPANLIVDFAPLHGRIALTTNEVRWDDLPSTPPQVNATERAFVEDLITRVTTERKLFCEPSTLGLRPGNFYRALKMARLMFTREQVDYSPQRLYYERAEHVVRRAINPRFYHLPVAGERYMFFPLHMSTDSAITIRAPQFQRQENLVQYLAERALPSGMKLYVKPHIGAQDVYSIPMVVQMARTPGVRLIDPRVNAHSLIKAAECVVVINSTVGFEALFHQRAVVVLGRVFYRGFGVTHDVENLADVGRAVAAAMKSRPDRDSIVRFLHACWSATTPGVFADASEQNVDLFATAVLGKLEKVRHARSHDRSSSRDVVTD